MALTSQELSPRLRNAGIACNAVVPVALLFGFLAADGTWPLDVSLWAVGFVAVIVPFITAFMRAFQGRRLTPLKQALDDLAAGRAPPPELLERARRLAFEQPWFTAAISLLLWGLIMPLGVVLPVTHAVSGRPWALLESVAIALVVGPLVAVTTLFTFEAIFRPAVAALFPDGGVERYRSRFTISTQARVMVTMLLLGPFTQVLFAFLTYRRVVGSGSMDEAIARLIPLEIYLLAASAFIVHLHATVLRAGIGTPTRRLTRAMEQVRQGNLEVRLPVEAADQLGVAAESFNGMVRSLQEKSWLQDAFRRYVSPEVATRALAGPVGLGSELREVTVLFSDIRNFTALSERTPPETLVALINRYFERMVGCVRAEGGSVNKFIGDGMLALFGAPSALPDAPLAAVRAALAMEGELAAFNAEQIARGDVEIAIGVGIASGPCVVGTIGALDRLEYTAIGDVVNTASRIEGLTKDFGATILLDEATYEAIRGRVPVGMKGTVAVKGKARPIQVYAPAVGSADSIPAPAR
ncbi:MAG: HAMP domain-containing protein [Candidatus Sericytochromatia bacterium]|nr:HAMP domain-containing protein [Candidatus Tanganyikabacteria bacterium]